MRLNAAQWGSMQLNAAQCRSMQLAETRCGDLFISCSSMQHNAAMWYQAMRFE
jgi:hypothetical protein